jgi:hypothetical protein
LMQLIINKYLLAIYITLYLELMTVWTKLVYSLKICSKELT